jgi:lysophospholipase L1-like esterase
MSRRSLAAAVTVLVLLVGAGTVLGFASGVFSGVLGDSGTTATSSSSPSPKNTSATPTPSRPTSATASAPATPGGAAARGETAITTPASAPPGTGYYVALGDSLAAGFQNGADHRTEGYVGAVRRAVEVRHGPTELVNLACSGETTTSMLRGGGCTYDRGSQLAEAERFLRGHAADMRLVTLDIGGNDVARCGFGGLKPSCTTPALATLAKNLPAITSRLRAAAPHVQVVVLNYYDPFLVLDLFGASGSSAPGQRSVAELAKVNAAIAGSARASGARVADVASAYDTTVTTPTVVKGVGTLPTNLARIITWTWMAPPRFDFHANDAGYAVMARAVDRQLR